MKLRNKETGEIKEWKDYEVRKEYWYIGGDGEVYEMRGESGYIITCRKLIGNYFETREEVKLAVRKLKAWKRLKDKGFRFNGWTIDDGLKISIRTNFEGDNIYSESEKEIRTNLNLLFGGEE